MNNGRKIQAERTGGRLKLFFNSRKVTPWIFILPFLLTFIVFFLYPILRSIVMSFQEILPGDIEFIGRKNYVKLFHDKVFWKAVSNSLVYTALTLIVLIPVPLVLATFINSKSMRGADFFKSILFIPALTSVVVAGTIFRLMFGELEGSLLNRFIALVGAAPVKWLNSSPVFVFTALLFLASWRWMGVNMLYFLAGLKNIPVEIYEAASIDGAGVWKRFTKITIPSLKPTIVYVLTISIYGGLSMFTESYMLFTNNNSPKNMGLTIVGYLYRQGIERNNLGYASAVGLILLTITMLLNILQLRLTNVVGGKGEK